MTMGQKSKGKMVPPSSGKSMPQQQPSSTIIPTANHKLPPTGAFSDPSGPLSSRPAGGGSRRSSLSHGTNPTTTSTTNGGSEHATGGSERRLDFEEEGRPNKKFNSSADALERMLNGSPDPQSPNLSQQHDTLEAVVELSPGSPIPMAYTASNGPTPHHHQAAGEQKRGEDERSWGYNINIYDEGTSRAVRQDSLKDIPMVSTDVFRPLPRMSPMRRRGGDPVSDVAPFDPFEAQQAASTIQEAVMHDGMAIHYNPLTGDSRVVSCAPFILRALLRRHRKAQYSKCQASLRESGQFKALCDLQGRHEMWRGRQRARRSTRRPRKSSSNHSNKTYGEGGDLEISSSLSSSFSLSDNDDNVDSGDRPDRKVKSRSYAVGLKADRLPVKLLVAGGTSVLDSLLRHNEAAPPTDIPSHQQLLKQRGGATSHQQRRGNCTSFTTPTFCAYCGCRFARLLVPVMGVPLDPPNAHKLNNIKNSGVGGMRGGRPDNSTLSVLLGSNSHRHNDTDGHHKTSDGSANRSVVEDYKVVATKYCTTCGRRAPSQPNVGGFGQHHPHHKSTIRATPSPQMGHTITAVGSSVLPNYKGGEETPNLEDSLMSTIGDDPLLMPSADARRANALRNLWSTAQQEHEASIRHSRAAAAVYNFGGGTDGEDQERGSRKHRDIRPEITDCMTQTNIQFGHLTFIPEPPPGAPPAILSPMDMDDSAILHQGDDTPQEDTTEGGTPSSAISTKKASSPQEVFQRKMILLLQSKMAADRVKAEQLRCAVGGGGAGADAGEQVFSGGGAGLAKSAFLIDQNARLKLKVDSLQHELDDARHRHMETARDIAKDLSRDLENKYRAQTAELTRLWSTLNTSLE